MNTMAMLSGKSSHLMRYACFNEIWLLQIQIRGEISQDNDHEIVYSMTFLTWEMVQIIIDDALYNFIIRNKLK
jgi:hypothetical protein